MNMRILLFGGFLGSGKTSTILQVAKQITQARNQTVAIIENEIGEAGIDDQLLRGSGFQVRPLFGGCVCCQITTDLLTAIQEIAATLTPDWIIIEMTGLAVPGTVAKSIRQLALDELACKTITIVDAARWHVLKRAVEPLILSQVAESDLLLINKTDVLGVDSSQVIEEVRAINTKAPIIRSSAKLELSLEVLEEVFRFA